MIQRLIFIIVFFAIVLVLGVSYFFYILHKGHDQWKKRIKNNPPDRMSKSKKKFIDFYLNLGYDNTIIEFVYMHTQDFLKAKDLVLLPLDDIVNLYERNEEEWFTVLNKWLKQMGCISISASDFNSAAYGSLNFEYLIRMIQSKKRSL